MDPSRISFSEDDDAGNLMLFEDKKKNSAKGKEGLCLFNVLMCIRLERLSN